MDMMCGLRWLMICWGCADSEILGSHDGEKVYIFFSIVTLCRLVSIFYEDRNRMFLQKICTFYESTWRHNPKEQNNAMTVGYICLEHMQYIW
jgi:hypothetical protein